MKNRYQNIIAIALLAVSAIALPSGAWAVSEQDDKENKRPPKTATDVVQKKKEKEGRDKNKDDNKGDKGDNNNNKNKRP